MIDGPILDPVEPSSAVELPPWVPPAVRDIARAIALGPDIATRLTSDPRMEPIWGWLKRRAQDNGGELEARLAALPERWLLEHWGLSEDHAPLPDQACAAFMACAVITLGVANKAVTRAGIEAQAKEWRRAASLCQAALALPGRPQFDPELAASLSASGEYLEEYAQYIEASAPLNFSHYLPRSSDKSGGGGDDLRAQARAIAVGARAIFGSFLYGIVATTTSVALQTDVREKSVRDWCADLPPCE